MAVVSSSDTHLCDSLQVICRHVWLTAPDTPAATDPQRAAQRPDEDGER